MIPPCECIITFIMWHVNTEFGLFVFTLVNDFSLYFCVFCDTLLLYSNNCNTLLLYNFRERKNPSTKNVGLCNKMEHIKILANRLKEFRESLGLTLADFSNSIGLKPQTYSAYEKGVNKPPIDVLIKIEDKYKISIDWLCGFSNLTNKKINLDTYADILHLLFELGFADGVELDSNFCKYLNNDAIFPFDVEDYKDVMMLYINDTGINDALKKWKKMFDLFKNNIIDEEVYRLWIEKTLSEYNSFYNADKNLITPENNPTITYKLQ